MCALSRQTSVERTITHTVKIERANLRQLIETGLQRGLDAKGLHSLLEGNEVSPAEIKEVLSELAPEKRRAAEKLLAIEPSVFRRGIVETTVPGRRIHDVRAQKREPWWSGVHADPLPALLHPEPSRDVDVHGERFTKDDVTSMLRSLAR